MVSAIAAWLTVLPVDTQLAESLVRSESREPLARNRGQRGTLLQKKAGERLVGSGGSLVVGSAGPVRRATNDATPSCGVEFRGSIAPLRVLDNSDVQIKS